MALACVCYPLVYCVYSDSFKSVLTRVYASSAGRPLFQIAIAYGSRSFEQLFDVVNACFAAGSRIRFHAMRLYALTELTTRKR